MNVSQATQYGPVLARQYLATQANTPAEDQLPELFDLWVQNNLGEQESNVGVTHPEALETAMAMIQTASQALSSEEGYLVLPGSRVQLGDSAAPGKFAVGLHELNLGRSGGNAIVGQKPVAYLFVDTTPGLDGTDFVVTRPQGK